MILLAVGGELLTLSITKHSTPPQVSTLAAGTIYERS